jgi:hypothetical protein
VASLGIGGRLGVGAIARSVSSPVENFGLPESSGTSARQARQLVVGSDWLASSFCLTMV